VGAPERLCVSLGSGHHDTRNDNNHRSDTRLVFTCHTCLYPIGRLFFKQKKTSSSSKRDPYEAYQPVQSKQDASFVNREEITHANPPLLIA
jgi:hypothetical protein